MCQNFNETSKVSIWHSQCLIALSCSEHESSLVIPRKSSNTEICMRNENTLDSGRGCKIRSLEMSFEFDSISSVSSAFWNENHNEEICPYKNDDTNLNCIRLNICSDFGCGCAATTFVQRLCRMINTKIYLCAKWRQEKKYFGTILLTFGRLLLPKIDHHYCPFRSSHPNRYNNSSQF
jgi:hypothetical protein